MTRAQRKQGSISTARLPGQHETLVEKIDTFGSQGSCDSSQRLLRVETDPTQSSVQFPTPPGSTVDNICSDSKNKPARRTHQMCFVRKCASSTFRRRMTRGSYWDDTASLQADNTHHSLVPRRRAGMRARWQRRDFSEWFDETRGLRQGCVSASNVFDMLFALRIVAFDRSSVDNTVVVDDLTPIVARGGMTASEL